MSGKKIQKKICGQKQVRKSKFTSAKQSENRGVGYGTHFLKIEVGIVQDSIKKQGKLFLEYREQYEAMLRLVVHYK